MLLYSTGHTCKAYALSTSVVHAIPGQTDYMHWPTLPQLALNVRVCLQASPLAPAGLLACYVYSLTAMHLSCMSSSRLTSSSSLVSG